MTRWTLLAGWGLCGAIFAGCGTLDYADPNPGDPFVFPGTSPSAPALAVHQPSYTYSPEASPPPQVNPALRVNPAVGDPPDNGGLVTREDLNALVQDNGNTASGALRAGDNITINFTDLPPPGWAEMKQRIREDGTITLPFNIELQAAGKTPGELERDIRNAYVPRYFVRFTATVKPEQRSYYVDGEVRKPDAYIYIGQPTVARAIATAGGFTDFAARNKVEVRRANGEKIRVNYDKLLKDPSRDIPIYPNDQIIVPRKGILF